MTLISVPLMTIVMPLNQALGIILPILIFLDLIAIYKYRKEFDLDAVVDEDALEGLTPEEIAALVERERDARGGERGAS